MRWTTLNYLSSLTNTLDLSTLLRLRTLMKLRLGATCLLSAKIAEKQTIVRMMKHSFRKKQILKENGRAAKLRN